MYKISRNFAVAVIIGMFISGTSVFAQTDDDVKPPVLIGAWEYVGPLTVDCDTREPNGPEARVSLLFNQGGTMFVEDTFPLEGPYRTTGPGIWKRETNGEFSYGHMHYSFAPDNTYLGMVKLRSRLVLERTGNSFTESGTFDVYDPAGTVVYSGCFGGTANRVVF